MEQSGKKYVLTPEDVIAGRYVLGQSLGVGTYGEVFYAEDLKFDPPRPVAIKRLHSQFLTNTTVLEGIKQEASTMARFNHPNILRVHDYDITQELAYIVTDLAAGSLQNELEPDPYKPTVALSIEKVVIYLEQIANGLEEAHNKGLIHRDLKPQNILLSKTGTLLLADFGIAVLVNKTSTSTLIETNTAGTPMYMAPEQWEGQSGKPSDIYALGVILYQMLTGQTPYRGNIAALMGQHINSAVPTLRMRAPELNYPLALDEVIARTMAKDSRSRLKSAKEVYRQFIAALEAPAEPMQLVVSSPTALEKVAPEPAPKGAETIQIIQTAPPPINYVRAELVEPKRETSAVIMAGIGGLIGVILVLILVLVFTSNTNSAQPQTAVASKGATSTPLPTVAIATPEPELIRSTATFKDEANLLNQADRDYLTKLMSGYGFDVTIATSNNYKEVNNFLLFADGLSNNPRNLTIGLSPNLKKTYLKVGDSIGITQAKLGEFSGAGDANFGAKDWRGGFEKIIKAIGAITTLPKPK